MSISDSAHALEDPTGDYPILADSRPQRVAVTFGATTDRGKVRGNNEDHFLLARLSKSMQVCKTSLPDNGKSLSPRRKAT